MTNPSLPGVFRSLAVALLAPLIGAIPQSAFADRWVSTVPFNHLPDPVSVPMGEVRQVAAGDSFAAVLLEDGTLRVWGTNGHGQLEVPDDLGSIHQMAAGSQHLVLLHGEGEVAVIGSNGDGQATPPAGLTGLKAVAAGYQSTFALTAAGEVLGWGEWSYTGDPVSVPPGLSGVVQVDAGRSHAAVLHSNGTVTVFGDDPGGENQPPSGLSEVVSIAVGDHHTLALHEDGTVTAWGDGLNFENVAPPGLNEVVKISAGWRHSVAVRESGEVVGWGYSEFGVSSPPSGLLAESVDCGRDFTIALSKDGVPRLWGDNDSVPDGGALDLANVKSFSFGVGFGVAVLPNGSLAGWGVSHRGQLDFPEPLPRALKVACGFSHGAVLLEGGEVATWGDPRTWVYSQPTELPPVTDIVAGRYFVAALSRTGDVFVWGRDAETTLLPPEDLGEVVEIAAGEEHILARTTSGQVFAWGDDSEGQASAPPIDDAVSIACGASHSLAVRADGTVVAWGLNDDGQTDVPAGLDQVVSIAGGPSHSVALRADGGVVAWGDAFRGATIVPHKLRDISDVRAFPYSSNTYFRSRTPAATFEIAAAEACLTGDAAHPDAVPHADRIPNLVKFAFGLDLSGPDWSRFAAASSSPGLPEILLAESRGARTLRYDFLRRRDIDLSYVPRKSVSFREADARSLVAVPSVVPLNDSWERVTYLEPIDGEPRMFGWIEVTETP